MEDVGKKGICARRRLQRKASMIEEMREGEKLVVSVGSGSRALRNQ